MGWPPEIFWAATPHELWSAVEGKREAAGEVDHPAEPPDQARIEALMAKFPD